PADRSDRVADGYPYLCTFLCLRPGVCAGRAGQQLRVIVDCGGDIACALRGAPCLVGVANRGRLTRGHLGSLIGCGSSIIIAVLLVPGPPARPNEVWRYRRRAIIVPDEQSCSDLGFAMTHQAIRTSM